MRRHNPGNTAPLLAVVVVLLAAVLLAVGGLGLFALRESEFARDRERLDRLDRAFLVEVRAGDRPRANAVLREQNAIIRKWPNRIPGRVEQRLLGTVP